MELNYQYMNMLANTPANCLGGNSNSSGTGTRRSKCEPPMPQQSLLSAMCTSGASLLPRREDKQSQHHAPTSFDSPISILGFHETEVQQRHKQRRREEERNLSPSPIEDMGEFYDQATWRMFQRIQNARQELYHGRCYTNNHYPAVPMMVPLDEARSGGATRLRPRNEVRPEVEEEVVDEHAYEEEDIFQMDL